tara:strand:- start:980 stop:2344 length:1365 start_codon:yes stop_codon:yes gene_type:complete
MNLKEKIYQNLPIFLQNIACNIEGYRIVNRRYSKEFFQKLKYIKYRNQLPKEKINDLKVIRLKSQLILAYKNTKYYKDLFDNIGFSPYKFDNLSALEMLPIQTKNDVQKNISNMTNKSILKKDFFLNHTSGTTGAGLIFPETNECEREKWSIWWRYRNNIGIDFDMWCAYFAGRNIVPIKQSMSPYWRVVKPTKQVMFSMHHLNKDSVKSYIDEINKSKLPWIHGYPSTISYIASMMLEQNLHINHQLTHITTGAESLLQNQKELIKRAFGIYPTQHYGLAEPVANISQCKFGKLHIDEDYSHLELIPLDGFKNKYKIVGTSLINDALMFLRYDTNDIVSLSQNQTCKCKNFGRIIDEIDGRKEDFLLQKDGTKVGRLDHIFKDMINVKEAQIKQFKNQGVIFYVVKNDNYKNYDEIILQKEIESRLNIDYEIEYLNKIKRTKSGKLKFVVSEI